MVRTRAVRHHGAGRLPLDYARLVEQVDAFASFLAGSGFRRGDAIAFAMPDGPEQLVAFLAASQAAVCAPLNPGFKEAEFEYYLRDLQAQALIVPEASDSPALAVAARLGIEVSRWPQFRTSQPASCATAPGTPDGAHRSRPTRPRPPCSCIPRPPPALPKLVPLAHANILASVKIGIAPFPRHRAAGPCCWFRSSICTASWPS